jgi:hypothetical protein
MIIQKSKNCGGMLEKSWLRLFFEYFERGEKSCDFSQRRKICLLVSFFIPDFWFFGLSAFVICYETFISLQLN